MAPPKEITPGAGQKATDIEPLFGTTVGSKKVVLTEDDFEEPVEEEIQPT